MNFSQRAGNERNSKVLRKPAQPNGKEIPRSPPRQSLLTKHDRAGRHGKMVGLRVGAKQKRVMQVFFSYDNSDRNFAKSLGDQLAKRGLSPWIADIELLPGDNWAHAIGEALKRSRAMVVLLSPDSVKSEYVRREVEFALGDSKFEGKVFPVLLRATKAKDVPWILRTLRILDAKEGPNRVAASIADALKMVASLN